ncbi:hypothetical protein NG791_16830 [Laspinema sp. D1]|uniref:hypothetical protein n=1 Tax=Laspinema palackyanum TaxID=3231601 RepID=UPI00348B7F81|nr:hypothetical protein [Laspinema sp. D2b]
MRIYLAAHHHQTNWLHQIYGDRIGCCIQPEKWGDPKIPYFLDNGAFTNWRQGKEFESAKFETLLEQASEHGQQTGNWPDFAVCPDRYGDPVATLELWDEWSDHIRAKGFKVAFVVQPGHDPRNTPPADLIFTGGGKPWKFEQIAIYRDRFPVHVGGITASKLYFCHLAKAVSGDSAGFFRGDMAQLQRLYNYLADVVGEIDPIKAPESTRRKKSQSAPEQLSLFGGWNAG